jgi:cytochrome c-type biogenesis protein CcmH/NrfF
MFPVAHVGHWLWVLYLPPILIVIGSLVRSRLLERRERRESEEAD